MSEDPLRQIAGDMNKAPGAAERASRSATLVTENNNLIADLAVRSMPFDSSPYAYQAWLADAGKR